MMFVRQIIIIFLAWLATFSVIGQTQILEYANKELYRGEAIIFTQNYKPPFKVGKLYTPSSNEIKKAENLMMERYNEDFEPFGWSVKNVRRKYWKYNRQYLGYINENGEKVLIINLLNFRCKKKAVERFPEWRKEYTIGFGPFYEENTSSFEVNLESGKLGL